MGLGEWIREKKESLIQKGVDRLIGQIDSWGSRKWPTGWIRIRRMGIGWKTILGAMLYYTEDITKFAEEWLPGVGQAVGLEDTQVQSVLRGLGGVLFLVGVGDKYVKFTKPIERRQGRRVVTSESGGVYILSPASAVPTGTMMAEARDMTPEERVMFDTTFTAEVRKGNSMEVAREEGWRTVAKARDRAHTK